MIYTLFFEAKGIQSYILSSNKLADMVGASELVDRICKPDPKDTDPSRQSILTQALSMLNIKEVDKISADPLKSNEVFFSRRDGGAFYAFFSDRNTRNQLRDFLSLAIAGFAPGLEFVFGQAESEEIKELIRKSFESLAIQRNFSTVSLPEITPVTLLAPRTGKAAVKKDKKIWIDIDSKAKTAFKNDDALAKRFAGDQYDLKFPLNLEKKESESQDEKAFPFLGDSRFLGLVHADGNGLGQILQNLKEKLSGYEYLNALKRFSNALSRATQKAGQEATLVVSKDVSTDGVMPMRPLVLGGDDITALVRADLAFEFTAKFCEAFESSTKEEFRDLGSDYPNVFEEKLTACAGVAIVKSSQPFYQALHLAEELCKEAKKKSKGISQKMPPASFAFYKVTNSFIEDYDQIVAKELTIDSQIATMGAYFLGNDHTPKWSDLVTLMNVLKNLGHKSSKSRARQYASLLFEGGGVAQEGWKRWQKVVEDEDKSSWNKLLNSLKHFGITEAQAPWTNENRTPMVDAVELMSLEIKMSIGVEK